MARRSRERITEAATTAMIVSILLIAVVWNLPDSAIKRTLTPVLTPLAVSTGLDQRWQMYAPDPIRRLEHLEVGVTMADGEHREWTIPRGDAVVGPFEWYRWHKLKENAVRQPDIRAGIAQWVVREVTEHGERPIRVVMTLRTETLVPPGQDGSGAVASEILYDELLTGRE